ncbi:MAG: hypothetical protein ACFCU1_13010 [Sumerlaeia bacterium]
MGIPAAFSAEAYKFEGSFSTIVVEISRYCISHFCSTMEGFDNLALVRTMDPGTEQLWIYTNTCHVDLVCKIIEEFNREFPIKISFIEEGMKGLDEASWD